MLDGFIRAAYELTHEVHSARTYLRLLAEAGVAGLPSASTVQRAISRMRATLTPKVAQATVMDREPTAVAEDAVRYLAKALTLLSNNIVNSVEFASPHRSDTVPRLEDRTVFEHLEQENRALRMEVAGLRAQLLAVQVALAQILNGGMPSPSGERPAGTGH